MNKCSDGVARSAGVGCDGSDAARRVDAHLEPHLIKGSATARPESLSSVRETVRSKGGVSFGPRAGAPSCRVGQSVSCRVAGPRLSSETAPPRAPRVLTGRVDETVVPRNYWARRRVRDQSHTTTTASGASEVA